MFAYCNNNPANYCDFSGASPITYCNGDRNPLFIGYYGCGGGGGGGGSSQYEDIFEELDAIKDKTLDTVGSVAEECWDYYMWCLGIEQQSQLQHAQLLIQGSEYFIENPKKGEAAIRGAAGTSIAVTKLVAASLAGSPTGLLIAAAAVALWDMGWTLYDIINDFQ